MTTFALATVLAAFMAGLALGSYYFGKIADRITNPLALYGFLEFGIGLYAVVITYLFQGLDNLYMLIGQSLTFHSVTLDVFRVFGAFVIILIPTTFMGGTLPLVSKFFVRSEREVGRKVGLLYGINTLGATLGIFLTGFFLIKSFGVQTTTHIAVVVNLIVAGAAFWIAYSVERPAIVASASRMERTVRSHKPELPEGRKLLRSVVLVAFGLSGFASLSYEVLWTRALIHFLGLTTYAFTTMLTTFLIGIAVGSFIISKFVDRLKNPLFWFALVELLIGIFALVLMPVIHLMYPLSQMIGEWFGRESWLGVVGNRFMITFIIMLPPTLCMGATMPLVVKYYTENLSVLGTGIGKVYAINTIGSILGSIASGFILVPLVGIRMGITIVVILNILIAVIVFLKNPKNSVPQKKLFAGLGVLCLAGVVLFADNRPMILSSVEFTGLQQRYDLLYVKESPDASIAVLQDKVTNERELSINGESTAFTIYQDMQVHKLLGHLPPLIHPAPKDFLVVGFGFGSTAYASTLYPDAQVDCVELLTNEIETASYFEKQNHGVVSYPNFNLVIGDGRDYIKLTKKKYDIISFNAIHPKISPSLYTLDFYKLCKRLLKENGIIIAWMPPNAITEEEYKSLVKTFAAAFSYSSLWYVNPSHMLILGTLKPLNIDWQHFKERLQEPQISADLEETNLQDPFEILSNFIATGNELALYVATADLNSDDKPLIEFSRVYSVTVNVEVIRSLQRIRRSVFPFLTNFKSATEQKFVMETLQHYDEIKKWVMEGQMLAWTGQYTAAKTMYHRALSLQPNNANTQYLLSLIETRKEELQKLVSINPQNMKATKAFGDIYLEEGNLQEAKKLFLRTLHIDPEYAEAHHSLGVVYFQEGRLDKALDSFENALMKKPDYGAAHLYSGQCYWRMGDALRALEHFQQAIDIDPDRAMNYYWFGLALEKTGRRAEAIAVLKQALTIDPSLEKARESLLELSHKASSSFQPN